MRLRTSFYTSIILAVAPLAARADVTTGPYVSLGAGYNITQDSHYRLHTDNGTTNRIDVRHGPGFAFQGGIGWGLGNGLRTELETTYIQTTDQHNVTNGSKKVTGSDRQYGALANAIYDIDLTRFGGNNIITPYVGVGLGYLWNHPGTNFGNDDLNGASRLSGTKGSFAYQGIIGAAYGFDQIPGLNATLEYRMVGSKNNSRYKLISNTPDVTSSYSSIKGRNIYNHQFLLGLRYALNVTPTATPVAVPMSTTVEAPQVAPARTYLVFFDFDRSNLTAKAREIVANAAQASTQVQTTRIEVNGYTDNSAAHPGPRGQRYNQALSVRRAESVKAELIRNGVPASAIDIRGYGEQNPLVPTGPNTREPQNRRVEIILH